MTPSARPAFVVLVLIALAAFGCSEASRRTDAAAMHAPAAPAAQPEAPVPGAAPRAFANPSRALRITIETSIVVRDLDAATTALRSATERRRGHVAQLNATGSGGDRAASLDLRIPVDDLASFRSELAGVGEVTSQSERAEDVTEQVADIGARLKNARTQESRLLDLLTNKTGNLGDVVAIEKELASVRETIERIEAQQRVLESQTSYADVEVRLSMHSAPATGAGGRIVHATQDGFSAAQSLVIGLVTVLAMVAPSGLIVALVAGAMYLVVRRIARWNKARAEKWLA